MRKELISKKEPGLDDFRNSQPSQIAEDTKSRFSVRKACSKEKVKGKLDNLLLALLKDHKI